MARCVIMQQAFSVSDNFDIDIEDIPSILRVVADDIDSDFTNCEQTLKQRSQNQKKGIHSYAHEIALEVSEYVGEPQKFAMWLGVVKRVGTARMVGLLRQMKEKGINSSRYLMACVKQEKR